MKTEVTIIMSQKNGRKMLEEHRKDKLTGHEVEVLAFQAISSPLLASQSTCHT